MSESRCVCCSQNLQLWDVCRTPSFESLGVFETALSAKIEPGKLFRCGECHLGLRLPSPDITLLSQVYASLPQDRWTAPLSVAQLTLIERLSQDDAKAVRLLDVGAFDGGFLKALPEHFEKCAIEPSAGGRAALEGLGIELLGDFLVKAPRSLEHQFDVVTMFDVYEHLVDPITGVKNLLSWLKPGGRLYIGTGNMDHWSWKVMKGRHWYLDPIQHVVVGSAQHFRFLGRMLDLKVTVQSFPHQSGDVGRRLRETLLTIYFALRSHSVFGSVASRVLHRLHVLRKHSHQRNIPYMQSLSDHILVTFQKKVDHC